jgi:hypothetical protein
MSYHSWLQNLRSALAPRRGHRHHGRRCSIRAATHQPILEVLEDRLTPSFTPFASFAGTNALIADFNNDTVPDLVRNAGSVLLGKGDGTFVPAPGPAVYGSAVGDLDGDGNLDLVAISGSGVNVLMGNGDGTFRAGSTISVAESEASVGSVAVGDFNGDGKLDLGVISSLYTSFYDPWYGNTGYTTSSAHVLLGNGGGDFSGPNTTDLGYTSYNSAVAADFNGDGIDDLATVYPGGVTLLLGDPSGFLQQYGQLNIPDYCLSVTVADLDGDLNADLVTSNNWGSVSVRLGNGAGDFGNPQNRDYATGYIQSSVAVADVNGDGKLDIVSTSNTSYYPAQPIYIGQLNVFLGYGDGTFAPAIPQPLDIGFASGLAASDFNGDGLADLVLTKSGQLNVLLNAGGWNAGSAVSINSTTVLEGDSGTVDAVFTVTRKGNLNGTVTVDYFTGDYDATAGKDFVAQSGTLTFGPGEATKTITIKVKGDLIDEYDQVFTVNLGATGVQLMNSTGVGTILDNDPPPTITITAKVSAKEGNTGTTSFKFIVTLSAPSEKEVRVNFATANGTATTADNDYVAQSGSLTFAPGQTSKTISIAVKGDKKNEATETFFLNLSSATNATILSAQGIGEILDDDTPFNGAGH